MNYNKWYNEYIKDLNIDNIEWINIDDRQLINFYDNNYFDTDNQSYVYDMDSYTNSHRVIPIGMHYLTFKNMPGFKYVLGIGNNNIGKKTIVACLAYVDEYLLFSDQQDYITYFSTIETNKYFRGYGLSKELIKNSYNFINHNQNILISELSDMGRKTNMLDMSIKTLKSLGFNMDIRSDTDNFNKEEYHKLVKRK